MNYESVYSSEDSNDYDFALRRAEALGANDPGEVATTAFLSAMKNFNPEKGTFKGFLSVCVRYRFYDELRRQNARKETHIPIECLNEEIAFQSDQSLSNEDLAILSRALKTLSEKDRILIRLRFWRGQSYKTIAENEAFRRTTPAGLRKRFGRALSALRAVPELRREFQNN